MKNVRFLTFFVPSPFSTSLNFSKNFGTLYDLDIVYVSSLYLEGVQMILGKIRIQKY